MAAMAAALPYLQTAGTILATVGALNQAGASASASRYNAQINEQKAATARAQGVAEAAQVDRKNYLRLSGIKAGYGASGIVGNEGSALDVLESSISEAALDRQNVIYNSELQAVGYGNSAALDRSRASAAESNGLYTAASTALLGGAKAYTMFKGAGSPLVTSG